MTAWAIVIAVLIIIALLRFGVRVEYSAEGVLIKLIAGPFSIKVYPTEQDEEKEERKRKKKAEKKALKQAKKKDKPVKKKPGMGVRDFLDMIPYLGNMLSRIKRRLLISELTIHFTAAGEDAAKIAMTYGMANAVIGELTPILENNFRIRRRDIQFNTDFISQEQTLYVNAAISLAVWEALYIVFALFPVLKIVFRRKKDGTDGKEENENGKAPDK